MTNLNSRQVQILELIEAKSTVSVNYLIESFQASPATIRKDLTYLESLNLIRRTRGEAHIQNKNLLPFIPFPLRSQSNATQKRLVAQEAFKLIEDGDTIILDDGTTTLEIAKLLDGFQHLTVITHSFDIANLLCSRSGITVIVPSGILTPETRSLLGPYTESFYSTIEANKFFLSTTGVRHNIGFTVTNPMESAVKKNAILASAQVIAVFDSSKWSQTAMNLCAAFDDVDMIVTDSTVPVADDIRELLAEKQIRLILAP